MITISHSRRGSAADVAHRVEAWPSAVAIIGEEAVTSPSSEQVEGEGQVERRVAAASWVGPRRPISSTSVAWIACWVRLARTSGQASASVARSSVAPHPPWLDR